MNINIINKTNNKHWIAIVCLITFLTLSLAFIVEKECLETSASISGYYESGIAIGEAVFPAIKYTKRFVGYTLKNEFKAFSMPVLNLECLGAVSIIYFFYIIHKLIPVGIKAPPKVCFNF